MKIYDKVKWHYPDGKGCDSLEMAMRHFQDIMNWLSRNNLLNEEGKQLENVSVFGEDFSLHDGMLTAAGKEILDEGYNEWLESGVSYTRASSFVVLEKKLAKCKHA